MKGNLKSREASSSTERKQARKSLFSSGKTHHHRLLLARLVRPDQSSSMTTTTSHAPNIVILLDLPPHYTLNKARALPRAPETVSAVTTYNFSLFVMNEKHIPPGRGF